MQLTDGGMYNVSLDELLRVLHHHVEQTVINMWFEYGFLPPP